MRLWKITQGIMLSTQYTIVCADDADEAMSRAINSGDISICASKPEIEELKMIPGILCSFYENGE